MRKLILAVAVIAMLSISAFSQSEPSKFDLFAGYSYTHVSGGGGGTSIPKGFEFAGTGYFNKNIGITGDVSGHYKSESGVDANVYQFLFGPTFRADVGRAKPFAHALFGGSRTGASISGVGSGSTTSFAQAYGGGVDVSASKNFSVRIVQADWIRTSPVDGLTLNYARLSFGIVFNVGSH
jgi:hypothetical protein